MLPVWWFGSGLIVVGICGVLILFVVGLLACVVLVGTSYVLAFELRGCLCVCLLIVGRLCVLMMCIWVNSVVMLHFLL